MICQKKVLLQYIPYFNIKSKYIYHLNQIGMWIVSLEFSYNRNATYPVGDGRLCAEVGEVGLCLEFPPTEPTVPTLSTFLSIKHPPGKAAHPPDEAAAVAAVVEDYLKI